MTLEHLVMSESKKAIKKKERKRKPRMKGMMEKKQESTEKASSGHG